MLGGHTWLNSFLFSSENSANWGGQLGQQQQRIKGM